ncbi:MAG: OB-fold nucleic acid binding domain-containing protein, partial [Sandaracinobacteroides sp.]
KARAGQPFASFEDVVRRAGLVPRAARLLADADAFGSLAMPRRIAHWEARRTPAGELPLFAAADAAELAAEPQASLPEMPLAEEVVADYQAIRLSLKAHPLAFRRELLRSMGVLSASEIGAARNGQWARMAGVVLVRQRPGNGSAVFITLEDETGISNCLLWARDFERQRREVMGARLMLVDGKVQRSPEGIVHLMVRRVTDRSDLLDSLGETAPDQPFEPPIARADEVLRGTAGDSRLPALRHPRDARIIPRSRDFH